MSTLGGASEGATTGGATIGGAGVGNAATGGGAAGGATIVVVTGGSVVGCLFSFIVATPIVITTIAPSAAATSGAPFFQFGGS